MLRSGVSLAMVSASLLFVLTTAASAEVDSGAIPSGSVEFTVAPPELTNKPVATFEFTASGDATCQLDDGEAWECTGPITTPELPDGRHSFTVSSSDGASSTHDWTVDTSKPHLSFRHTIKGFTGNNIPVTNERSASFSFSTSDPTAELTCRIDPPINYVHLDLSDGRKARIPVGSGPFVPCASPQALSDLPEGHHMASIRAVDRAGNVTSQGITWKVDYDYLPPDTTPPSVRIDLPRKVDPYTYEIPFSISEEASVTCRLRAGSILQSTSSLKVENCGSPIVWTDIPEGQVSVMVEATDPSGNVTTVGRGWTVDRTPPEVILSEGPEPVSGSDNVFRFSSSESSTPQTLECSLDSGPWRSCASPVELKGLGDGPHSFAIRATDGYGNTGEPTVTEWIVDATAPEVRITSGPDRRTSSTTATFELEAPTDAAEIECRLDASGWERCATPIELAGLTEGPHTFQARAIDPVGNTGPAASFEWTVDTSGPAITLVQTPASPSQSATARFSWTSESGATFRCRFNSRPWETCSSPISASSLPDGANRFEVVGTDTLGNQGSPAVFTWVVNTPPPVSTPAPTVSIVSGPSGLTSSRAAEFVIEHSPGSTLSCRSTLTLFPFTVGWKACESPVVLGGFQDGTQTFEVRATSSEGRVSVVRGWSWRVDTVAPRVAFNSKPIATTATTLADFVFTSADRTATFLCSLDSAPIAPCSSPVQSSGLGLGSHTFEVVAVDPAGNRSAPLRHTWEVIEPDPDYTVFGEVAFPATEPEPQPLDPGNPKNEDGPEDPEPSATTGNPVAPPLESGSAATPTPRLVSPPSRTSSRRPLFRLGAPAAGTTHLCSIDRGQPVRCGSAWRPPARLSTGVHLFQARLQTADGNLSGPVTHRFRVTRQR